MKKRKIRLPIKQSKSRSKRYFRAYLDSIMEFSMHTFRTSPFNLSMKEAKSLARGVVRIIRKNHLAAIAAGRIKW